MLKIATQLTIHGIILDKWQKTGCRYHIESPMFSYKYRPFNQGSFFIPDYPGNGNPSREGKMARFFLIG